MQILKRILLLSSFTFLFLLTGRAQNIVPNNGFESYSSLPTGYGQWYKITGWYNLNGYLGFMWPYASPDFLHSSGTGGVDLPVNTFANVNAYAGNAILGFTAWHGTTAEFREYIAIQFSSPMVVGTTYDVSLWITNGYAGWYCGASCNHIGLKFTMTMPTQTDHEPIGGIPQCEYVGEIWSTTWQYISFTYTADQAYNYVSIGNFYNDASTTHTTHEPFALANAAYYFIDEVVVAPAAALPVTLSDFYAKENNRTVDLFWNTESELNNDYFIVEKSADAIHFKEFGIVDAAGNSQKYLNYYLNDDQPYNGMNYYRLAAVDFNGEKTYSDIIQIEIRQLYEELFTVYPNPCSDVLFVTDGDNGIEYSVRLYNMDGQLINFLNSATGEVRIEMADLPKGIYFLQILNGEQIEVKKIMRN